MNNKLKGAFRTTKVLMSEFPAGETRDKLEQLFMTYEAVRTDAVTAEREAQIATHKATIKRSEAQLAETVLLQAAALHNNQIAGDRIWTAFRGKDGIVFEGISERLIRNAKRAHIQSMGKSLDEDENIDMYEDSDESEDDTKEE